jgi:hypothetical protein
MADRAIAAGTGITFTGTTPAPLTINALIQEIPFSFLSDSPGYYTATVACTVGSPSTIRGTGSVAWAYSTDGTTFNTATFPLSMAANSVLRCTSSSVTTYLSVTVQRT